MTASCSTAAARPSWTPLQETAIVRFVAGGVTTPSPPAGPDYVLARTGYELSGCDRAGSRAAHCVDADPERHHPVAQPLITPLRARASVGGSPSQAAAVSSRRGTRSPALQQRANSRASTAGSAAHRPSTCRMSSASSSRASGRGVTSQARSSRVSRCGWRAPPSRADSGSSPPARRPAGWRLVGVDEHEAGSGRLRGAGGALRPAAT